MTLQDEQLPIDQEIARQLRACVPAAWTSIDLSVDVTWHPDHEDIAVDITSTDRDAAEATISDELYAAVTALVDLVKSHGKRVAMIRGHAGPDPRGRWQYHAHFTYVT